MGGFDAFRREIVAPRSHGEKLLGALLAVFVPALLRWVVDRGAGGAPFVTFWPAILLASAFLDWRYASLTAVGSAFVGVFLFIPNEPGSTTRLEVILPFFVTGVATMIFVGHLLRGAVIEVEERVRQSETFNMELQHRAKNALQMMRALASRASKATDPTEFYETLASRLDALAQANELLRFGVLDSCELEELIRVALRPFPSSQIACSGPKCQVVKNAVTPLTMALHELGTNASKYGALSCVEGRVEVTWRHAADGMIAVEWVESGGPEVAAPSRKGVGARLLQSYGALHEVTLEYRPDGVRCRISVPEASA
jgi:two-component sensor histidine kinase